VTEKRRRPRPLGERAVTRASDTLSLRVARTPARPSAGIFAGQMFGVFMRKKVVTPYRVEIVDRESGVALAAEPVDGGEGEARGLMEVMRADLESMDAGSFVMRWGRPRL
jgi:hypothetical protein